MKNKTALGIGATVLGATIGLGIVACDTTSRHHIPKIERTIEVPIQSEMPDDATIPDYYVDPIDND